jgi:redox-sensitive bicupin YhaK (pirin superfamily)
MTKKDGARVRVIAGEYDRIKGPVTEIAIKPLYMDITLDSGAEIDLPTKLGHFVIAYVFEGAGCFGFDDNQPGELVQGSANDRV